jgi:hypothetical protein
MLQEKVRFSENAEKYWFENLKQSVLQVTWGVCEQ